MGRAAIIVAGVIKPQRMTDFMDVGCEAMLANDWINQIVDPRAAVISRIEPDRARDLVVAAGLGPRARWKVGVRITDIRRRVGKLDVGRIGLGSGCFDEINCEDVIPKGHRKPSGLLLCITERGPTACFTETRGKTG